MPKLQRAIVATAAWASMTSAQALKDHTNTPESEAGTQVFRCGALGAEQDKIVAADPPRAVIVDLTISSNKVTHFIVSYVEDNGHRTNPADKTKPWLLVTMPSGHDYHWYATDSRQPNLLFHGRLFEHPTANELQRRWFYYEEQFEAGIKTGDIQAACAKE